MLLWGLTMLCAKCRRYITKPSALSGGLPVGPVCAVRLGLVAPRSGKREPAPLVLPGQLRLQFEEAAA